MSREEHDRLVSEGRCFICKEAGHMSRQCPKWTTVPSTHKDKPPGVPNYAMHIETGLDGERQALEDSTELITEIPLNVALLQYEIPKKPVYRTWGVADEPIGDPLARRAEEILRQSAPYPGDDLTSEETFAKDRFLIYRILAVRHIIMDHGTHLKEELEIPSFLLRNPVFFVGDWYANRLAEDCEVPKSMRRCMQRRKPMGDPIADRVEEILNRKNQLKSGSSAIEQPMVMTSSMRYWIKS